jgi:cytochrome c oxidase assembly protein subunit 15
MAGVPGLDGSSSATENRRLPTVSVGTFRSLAVVSLAFSVLIVLSGAAVRLSGSGLGCPDWPSCYKTQFTPQLSYHPVIEFGNRMVTVVIVIVFAATLVAAYRRRPQRRDLIWLSWGLVAGVLAQAAVGAVVIYTKLNPYVVMGHFLASMLLIVDALVLVHRSTRRYGPGTGALVVPRPVLLLGRGLLALLGLVLAAGTATTGAGPHAGGNQGQLVAKRIPIALRDMAELHSTLAMLLIGVTISLAVLLHALDVPERVRRGARVLTLVLVAQAAVGYAQYFSHLPALLVELHVLGATSILIGSVQLYLAFARHPAEVTAPQAATTDQEAVPAGALGHP